MSLIYSTFPTLPSELLSFCLKEENLVRSIELLSAPTSEAEFKHLYPTISLDKLLDQLNQVHKERLLSKKKAELAATKAELIKQEKELANIRESMGSKKKVDFMLPSTAKIRASESGTWITISPQQMTKSDFISLLENNAEVIYNKLALNHTKMIQLIFS